VLLNALHDCQLLNKLLLAQPILLVLMNEGILAQHPCASCDYLVEWVDKQLTVVYQRRTSVISSESMTVDQIATAACKCLWVVWPPRYQHRRLRFQTAMLAEDFVFDGLPAVVAE